MTFINFEECSHVSDQLRCREKVESNEQKDSLREEGEIFQIKVDENVIMIIVLPICFLTVQVWRLSLLADAQCLAVCS